VWHRGVLGVGIRVLMLVLVLVLTQLCVLLFTHLRPLCAVITQVPVGHRRDGA
jgi:hypothetical protein